MSSVHASLQIFMACGRNPQPTRTNHLPRPARPRSTVLSHGAIQLWACRSVLRTSGSCVAELRAMPSAIDESLRISPFQEFPRYAAGPGSV
jgi:hypothetical protein